MLLFSKGPISFALDLSYQLIYILPVLFAGLMERKAIKQRRRLAWIIFALLETLAIAPSAIIIVTDYDPVYLAIVVGFLCVTSFFTYSPFVLPVLAVFIAVMSKLRSKLSKVLFVLLIVAEVILVVLRIKYGLNWMNAVRDLADHIP